VLVALNALDRVIYLSDGAIQRIERNEHKRSPAELSW